MSSKNPGEDYYNYFANDNFTVGDNLVDPSVFSFGERVIVIFYDGDFAYGNMASRYCPKSHKYMRLTPGTYLLTPTSTTKSKGLTFKTAIVSHIQRV